MDIQRPRSSCFYNWTFDVFLNFRGEDTRTGFTGFLYNALRQKGIHTFFDDVAIQRGKEITPSLLKAIEESRMAITVFSPNYASSAYCLDELVHILEHIKRQGRLVWPVFYDVDPSQVRNQKGSYAEALTRHEERYGKEKVRKWSLALSEAANLAGLEIKQGNGYEYVYIQKIIEDVSTKINRTPLHVTDYPVGLESRVLEVNSLLNKAGSDEGVIMVGICGIGGVGKTTVARAVYNLIGDKFESLCFLSSVREISNKHGLSHLQEILLAKIVGEKDIKLGDVNEGASLIKHRLCQMKVLLVLDDVDEHEQLKVVVGSCDWFGYGSRIIITTRDKHLVARHGIDRIYEVKELNDEEALQLFRYKAFGQDEVNPSYLEISEHVARNCCGLPLALEVIGSNFYGREIDEWISALDGHDKTLYAKIFKVLQLSYDTLEYIEQEIFLDVACFFNGYSLEYVYEMLQAIHGINPKYGIGVLIEKSLMKISEYDEVTMHDLVQDMGKEIIKKESPKEAGGRSRLWFYEDILHVLQENTGTDKIEVIILDLPEGKEEVQWSGKAFKKMKNLKVLVIRNARFAIGPTHLPNNLRVLDWSHYPGKVLPFDFHPTNIFRLELTESNCVSLGSLFTKNMENLTIMDFSYCKFLTLVPNLTGVTNLGELYLDGCPNLIEIHDSVGFLSKLRVLSAVECINLKTLPYGFKLKFLELLNLSGCSSLQRFPEVLEEMEMTTKISLSRTAIEELPYSIRNLTSLQGLYLLYCKHLKQLPTSLLMLPNLEDLRADSCSQFRHFGMREGEEAERETKLDLNLNLDISERRLNLSDCNLSDESLSVCLSYFLSVTELDLSLNNITILPACIEECHHLQILLVSSCGQLRLIEGMPPNLEFFNAEYCVSLTSQSLCMLLSQGFHKPGSRDFIFPGHEVPECFHHCSNGSTMQFWFREDFPPLVVCFVIPTTVHYGFPDIILTINSVPVTSFLPESLTDFPFIRIPGDHIYAFDLQKYFDEDQLQEPILPDQWNHVEVFGYIDGEALKSVGVHVYKQDKSMQNIQFSRPTSFKRTWHWVYDSNDDLALGCHPLMKKQIMSLCVENNDIGEWFSLPSPCSYVNGDSNSTALCSTRDTISGQDGALEQTSSEKQPHKIEMEIRLASLQPTVPPLESSMVPVAEENHEEVDLSYNQESFSPPNFQINEVSMNTSVDLESLNKMIKEDPMSALERLLTKKISVSSKMHQSATQSGEHVVQISSFEALQKELKSLLTKFDLSSLIDMHRSKIYFNIEELEKKFESLPPAHQSFITNFRSFFVNAASNYDKLNEVRKREFQLKVEKEDVEKKLEEAKAKDEKMTALVSSASLRVKEIVSSIEEVEGQLMKLKQEKEAFELAINECGKHKEILRRGCISWVKQSKDLVVELMKTEETAQFLKDQVKADETKFHELVASIPF